MLILCYPKCSTCKKALKWLDDHHIKYDLRDIVLDHPNKEELKLWYEKSNLPLKRFFNTSGLKYRELELSKKLDTMSDKEQLELLSTDGMLVKRPFVITKSHVLCGFREKEWEKYLK